MQKLAGWTVDRGPDANQKREYQLFDADGDDPAGCWNTTRAPIRSGLQPITSEGWVQEFRPGRSPEQLRMTAQGSAPDNRLSAEGGGDQPAEKLERSPP
jgi:hypothetical protein